MIFSETYSAVLQDNFRKHRAQAMKAADVLTRTTDALNQNRCNKQRSTVMKRIAALAILFASACAIAQNDMSMPKDSRSDADKIADALKAGPEFVTKDATVVDWPKTKDGEYRVLRPGTNGWTCLPGLGAAHQDEPGCYDPAFFTWIKDTLAGRTPHLDRVGMSYMYAGKWLATKDHPSQDDPHAFHVGPHIMIVTPDSNELTLMNRDGTGGLAYVNGLPGRPGLFLVIPIKQWGDPYVTKPMEPMNH
jgi:hypothetical protein